MKHLYSLLLWATMLLMIAIPVFFAYMLFFDSSEGGIPAKTAIGNQQAREANLTDGLPLNNGHYADEGATLTLDVVTDCLYSGSDSDFGSHGS